MRALAVVAAVALAFPVPAMAYANAEIDSLTLSVQKL